MKTRCWKVTRFALVLGLAGSAVGPPVWAQEAPVLEIALYPGIRVTGEVGATYVQQRMQALVAFTLPACSRPWRRHVLDRFACLPRDEEVRLGTPCARRRQGVVANGLGPCDPRRQQLERLAPLERQRQELPVSQPQQQRPGQQEQQPGFSGPAGPSSIPHGGTDPAAILSPERGVTGQTAVEQGPV